MLSPRPLPSESLKIGLGLKGKVEQDFTAVTLTVIGIEFLDRPIQRSAYKHTDKASPLCTPYPC